MGLWDIFWALNTGLEQCAWVGAGLVMGGVGGVLLWDNRRMMKRARAHTATVTGILEKKGSYYPLVTYTNETGARIEAESNMGVGAAHQLPQIGETLTVYIDPEKPQEALVYRKTMAIVGIVLFAVCGLLMWIGLGTRPFSWGTPVVAVALLGMGGLKLRNWMEENNTPSLAEMMMKIKEGALNSSHDREDASGAASARLRQDSAVPVFSGTGARKLEPDDITAMFKKSRREHKTGAPVCFILALGLGWLSYYFGVDLYHLEQKGLRAPGTVIALQSETSHDSDGTSTSYYPLVRYTSAEGSDITFRHKIGSNPPMYETGEAVTVLYDPDNPKNKARIDSGLWNWLLPGGMGLVALLLLWAGVWNFKKILAQKRQAL